MNINININININGKATATAAVSGRRRRAAVRGYRWRVATAADGAPEHTPERTPDGHHIIIQGRRWRATDPDIPPTLAAELRSTLMAARRAVGTALKNGADPTSARGRVNAAKIALGERGHPWWEEPTAASTQERIAATIRAMVDARSPRTTCPSDIARIVGGSTWRTAMPVVRDVAEELVAAGEVIVTQRGEPAQPPWRGPIRIRRREAGGSSDRPSAAC